MADLSAQPGQLLVVGFDGVDEVPGDLVRLIEMGRVGGVILFSRNIRGPEQLRTLVSALYSYAPPDCPLLVTVDQEGGRVQRLKEPWTRWPPMRRLGERDDLGQTRAVGAALAREVADVGFCVDFTPSVDVDSNPANPVIGDRSFGRTPAVVAKHAVALVEGLQSGGVAGCRCPGHRPKSLDFFEPLSKKS